MRLKKSIVMLMLLVVLASVHVSAEYEIGAQIHGFTLTEEREMKSPSALLRIWQHDKTGAQVYFIHNDDQDRTFSIAFRTEPSDDTGKLHILEHAVCAASEKYPGQDVFFDAVAQAYITDINAVTYKSATNYYVSSMSEDQLERLTDFYLDCAFHSALRNEPNYFYREGWRYTMEEEDAPLSVDGIVYNEMKGVFGDIYSIHYTRGLENALFPDTYQRWESGGNPAMIPELTYEELIDFYDECYHPSNSISMFYGDVETERYLRLMDEEYFSKFEAQDSAGYSPGQEPFAQMVRYEQEFPVAADSEQTGGLISYAVAFPEGVDFKELFAISMCKDYLGDPSSALMDALYASGIGSGYYVEDTMVGTQYALIFTADEADTMRAEEFKNIVTENLDAMIEDGFDQEMIDSIFAEAALSDALVINQRGIGIEMAERIALVVDSGYEEMLDYSAYYEEIKERCENGGLETLIDKYVLSNTHAALVTTTPGMGLLEEQEAAEVQRLAEIKAFMNQEELNQIIEETAAFTKWNDEIGSVPETLEKLRTDTPDTVDSDLQVYKTAVFEEDGVNLYTADVDGEATYCEYIFDLSHMKKEEIRALDVYLELLGMSTEKHSQREISVAMKSLLSGVDAGVDVNTSKDGRVYPILTLSFYALDKNLEEAAGLFMEMFCETDISENTEYFETALANKLQEFYDVESVADDMALDAAFSGSSDSSAMQYILFGMDYYNWLTELREMDIDEMAAVFANAREKALVREGAEVIAVGNAAGREARCEILCALLPEKTKLQEYYDWKTELSERPGQTIAFKANGTSSYVVAGVDVTSIGLKNTGELQLLLTYMEDAYLRPEFRFQLGAYGVGSSLSQIGRFKFELYRSPSYMEAFTRLSELPGEMEETLMKMTAEELAGYQLSIISSMTQPYGSLNEAVQQINDQRRGIHPEDRQIVLDQVCSATPMRLTEALPQLQEMINAMGSAVVAPGTAVEEHKDLFESVVILP